VTFDLLLAFVAFGFFIAVTPGPNSVVLLASRVNLALLRSVPHILGTVFGMVVMIAGGGMGLAGPFRTYPVLYGVLRWVGVAEHLGDHVERGSLSQGQGARGVTQIVEANLYREAGLLKVVQEGAHHSVAPADRGSCPSCSGRQSQDPPKSSPPFSPRAAWHGAR
jgi:hypothetical protein